MKQVSKLILSVFIATILVISVMATTDGYGQKKQSSFKIGTYDSRIVTFAWSRSDFFKQHMIRINQQTDSAQKAHDTTRLKEVSVGAMSYQHLLHQMVFSNGSAGCIMVLIKDKLPELAKTAGVSIILSKWEVNFSDPSIEIIDLTSQVAQLFRPKESVDKMGEEISRQSPVPIDELDIESDMLDLYCQRFGQK